MLDGSGGKGDSDGDVVNSAESGSIPYLFISIFPGFLDSSFVGICFCSNLPQRRSK